jgi:hypothetical protein
MNIFSNIKKDMIILGIMLVVSGLIGLYALHDVHAHHKSVFHQLKVQVLPSAPVAVVVQPSQHDMDVKLHKAQIHYLCETLMNHPNLSPTTVHALAHEIETLEAIDAE